MNLKTVLILLSLACTQAAWAQMDTKPKHKKAKIEDSKLLPEIETDANDEDDDVETMSYQEKEKSHILLEDIRNSYSVSLPMNRNGSGTAWNPDKSPMYKYHLYTHRWLFIFHGDVFLRFNKQDILAGGTRGSDNLDAKSLVGFMGHRKSGLDGLFHFNVFLSTDAAIAHGAGFSQLFQTSNKWNGKESMDRQRPNNILSELSASYAYSFSDHGDMFIYGGYPAEPALGPVSYFKRPSGAFIPDAPLSSNWTDGTYTSYGVGTVGLRIWKLKLEGSAFTGRLPDKNNFNLNLPFFNSRSGRLSFNPTAQWALQVSRGYIVSPDVMHPTVNVMRTTASATHVHAIGPRKYVSYTLLWGKNETDGRPISNAVLVEGTRRMKQLVTYCRAEWVQKSGEELNLSPIMYNRSLQYNVSGLTIGGSYDLLRLKFLTIAGGAQVTGNLADASLNTLYGQYPVSGQVYLHVLPGLQ